MRSGCFVRLACSASFHWASRFRTSAFGTVNILRTALSVRSAFVFAGTAEGGRSSRLHRSTDETFWTAVWRRFFGRNPTARGGGQARLERRRRRSPTLPDSRRISNGTPSAAWPTPTIAALPSAPRASPSARRRSRRRTTGGGRLDYDAPGARRAHLAAAPRPHRVRRPAGALRRVARRSERLKTTAARLGKRQSAS